MTLSDLVRALAAAGEQASEQARREYLADVEAWHAAKASTLPGSPPVATIVPLDTLRPKTLKLATNVTLSEEGGSIEVEFTASPRHWWNRTPRNVSTLEIEWDRQEAPEGVCRIRDKQNEKQDKVTLDG